MLRLLLITLIIFSSSAATAEELPWLIEPSAGSTEIIPTAKKPEVPRLNLIGTIIFNGQESDIAYDDDNLTNALMFLKEKEGNRIQIEAYAESETDQKNKARQLSLKRAVAIRRILMKKGIAADRIVVRALGSNTSANKNRTDILAL